MGMSNSDYSISVGANVDTSQAQKTLDQLINKNNKRDIVFKLDVDTKTAFDKINNDLNNQLGRQVDATMQRISTKIKTGLKGSFEGQDYSDLIKTVETYKNKIGDVQERTAIFTKTGELLTSTLQTVAYGIKDVTTTTESYIQKIDGVDTKVTMVSKTMTDTSGKIHTVNEETKEWVNLSGEVITQTTKTDENLEQLGATVTNVSNDIKKATKLTKEFAEEARKANMDSALVSTTTKTSKGKVTQFGDTSGKEYRALITTIEQIDAAGKKTIKTIQEFTNSEGQLVRQTRVTDENLKKIAEDEIIVGENAKKGSNGVNSLNWSLSDAFRRLANFYLASLPIRLFQTAITDTVQVVKDFDSAITEMGKVSDYSGEKLQSYTRKLADLGTEVARTQTEMTEAATGWLKAGYSEEDAALLSKYSALLQNTADEQISAADATSILVSQLKAYHMEAEEAIKVTDIINAVSAQQAVSSADISQGLTVASAAMSTFGNTIEETTALLTAGTTIFQGRSSQVARGLNMIATRVAKNKDELAKYGVNINDANGQLRSTYEILVDLAPAWNTMSKAEQVALGNTLAGTNQYKILAAIMSQMDVAIETYDQALNSSGETMKQNAVYMSSLEAKTTALKAEFEKLVIGNGGLQDIAKIFVSFGTTILKVINGLGGLVPLLVAVGGALLAIKIDKVSKGFTAFFTTIEKVVDSIPQFISRFNAARASTNSLAEAFEVAAAGASILQLAIGALTAIISIGLIAYNNYKQAQQEAHDKAKQSQEDYKNYADSIVETYEKIKTETTSKKDLIEINKQLNGSYQDEKSALGDVNDLRKENLKLLYEENKQKAKQAVRESASEVQKAEEYINSTVGVGDVAYYQTLKHPFRGTTPEFNSIMSSTLGQTREEQIESIGKAIDELNERIKNNNLIMGDEAKTLELLSEASAELQSELDDSNETINNNTENVRQAEKTYQEFLNELEGYDIPEGIRKELEELGKGGNVDLTIRPVIDTEELNKQGYDAGKGFATLFSHTFTDETDTHKATKAINFTPILTDPKTGEYLGVFSKPQFEKYCQDVVEGKSEDYLHLQIGAEFNEKDYDNFIEKAEEAGKRASELHGQIYGDIQESKESVDEIIQKYNLEADAISEVMEANEVSYEEAVRLLGEQAKAAETSKQTWEELNKEYDNALKASSTLVSSISEVSSALEEQDKNGSLSLTTQLKLIESGYALALTYDEETGACKLDQDAVKKLVEAKIEMQIANLEISRSNITAQLAEEGKAAVVAAGDFLLLAKAKNLANSASLSDNNARGGYDPSKSYAGYGGNFGYLKNDTAQVDALNKEIEALDNLLNNVKDNGTDAFKSIGGAAKSAGGKVKDAAEEAKKALEETKKQYETVIKWITKQYDKKIDAIKKSKDEAVKAIEKEIKALEKEKDTILDNIEKETDALEKEKDARKKYWDDQIDALKKANDARKDALELQEKLDALERARNTKVKIYKEGQGFVYDVDQTKVAEAQKELDEYLSEKAYEDELARLEALRDAELDNYEKRIDALNEYKDKVQKSYEEQIDALKNHKEALEEQYDAEIEMYQNYKQQFEDMVNAYQEEQDKLLFEQLTGIKAESDNWMTRLDNLAEFVRKYNELQKQLNTGNTGVSNDASMKGGNTVSSGSNPKGTQQPKYDDRGYRLNEVTTKTANIPFSNQKQQFIPYSGTTNVSSNGVIKKHASGVGSIKDDELAIVGENPNQEIVIGSKLNNGELMSLNKGSGVVNADSSSTLAGMLNQVGKFGSSGFGSGNGTLNSNINNDTLTINGVTIQGANIKDPETFVNGLLNLKAEALQRAYRHR